MRVPFSSLEFPLKSAGRLARLLPALSPEQAQDWTAQVYGYRNWVQLSFEVENLADPIVRGLAPDLQYALDCHRASGVALNTHDRDEQQIQKLDELLGWTYRAAEHLYVEWEPRGYRCNEDALLADLGLGTPAYRLVQRNVFVEITESGPISASDTAQVFLGYPGTAEQLRTAGDAFLSKLPAEFSTAERAELAGLLARQHRITPELRPVGGANTFAQVLPMAFFVCPPDDVEELIGAAFVTFALIASCDGTHSVKITVERVVSLPGQEHRPVLADALAVSMWEAVTRYLWCTVGNADKDALVLVEHRADVPGEALFALTMLNEILVNCGWPDRNDRPELLGIRFELSARSADLHAEFAPK